MVERFPGKKVIGLTGNIACGKSTVAGMLRDLGAAIIDADAVVHQLQEPGTAVWREIVRVFGEQILRPDGRIDRGKLGAIVFADAQALLQLERVVHPQTIAEVNRQVDSAVEAVAVIEAIKLVESGLHRRCDSVWVVSCSPKCQLERLRGRGLTEAEARLRLQAQPPAEPKLAVADVVIDNDGSEENTREQVELAWQRLVSCP